MKYSIVIPAFNGEKYIEKAILSAINQTREPDEIIVHDDNSSDSTAKICNKYIHKIRYILNVNGPSGFVCGWNQSVSFAKSDFIVILHQDDLLYPCFLEKAENILNNNRDVLHLFALCEYINHADQNIINLNQYKAYNPSNCEFIRYSYREYINAYQQSYNQIPHIHRCPGVVTHRSIFEKGCIYNPEAGHLADDDFFYRVGKFTDIIGIMEPLAAYRIHENSETGRINDFELSNRLARDYIFQIKQYKNNNIIGYKAKKYFEYWAFKYTARASGYALKYNDRRMQEIALDYINQINAIEYDGKKLFLKCKLFVIKMMLIINGRKFKTT
jgi:glycosyltransferase involved in cell wall biosynthesis